jgi:NitT/TauT family transport system substrate-binding protein
MNGNTDHVDRRELLLSAVAAGTAALVGYRVEPLRAEPSPETLRLRLGWTGSTCQAPQYVADELLKLEGFQEVEFVDLSEGGGIGVARSLAAGRADLTMNFVGPLLVELDSGAPLVLLAGGHVGCFELVARESVRAIRDLKDRTVAVADPVTTFIFLDSLVSYVGLDPRKTMNIVFYPAAEAIKLLVEGRIDAYLAFPPATQELRARKIGHVVVATVVDRPWSQYFCCLLAGNREFVRLHPVATKRAMRAILKSADLCAAEPDRAARALAAKRYTTQYDYALQLMRDIPYGRWREYDPGDTIRFYGLRMHETGIIKSHPNKLIAQGTDWRFLNELRKELKG